MKTIDLLAAEFRVAPEKMRYLLTRLTEVRRGVLVDVGGLRGVVRPVPGSQEKTLVLEKYLAVENPPSLKELLDE